MMDLLNEKYSFSVARALKKLNKEYKKDYTVADVAEKCGLSKGILSRLTTDSKFSVLYTVTKEIYNLYLEYQNKTGKDYVIEDILLMMNDDDMFCL